MNFLQELKRRHVYRIAAAYAVVGWVLIQVVTQVFPVFALPSWSEQLIVLLILIGFPIALVLAWAFDATPQGIVATDSRDAGSNPRGRQHSRRAGAAVGAIGVLIALVAGGTYWHFGRLTTRSVVKVAGTAHGAIHSPDSASAEAPSSLHVASAPSDALVVAIPAKSVAVLPFVNMSGDPKNEYFSDGITEEILDALAQLPNLKVAARTSAFAFKGKAEDLRKVGEVLDVATVLEGSVQQSGDEVRITAQLIDARSGYHLWSEKYDRKLISIFAVEDEISKAITDKLKVQLAGGSGQSIVAQKAVDPRAHDFYLRGLPLVAARGPALREAVADFQQAVAIDPDYAQAWAALAEAQLLLPHYFLEPQATAAPAGEAAAHRALEIDPDTATAYVALAMHYRVLWKWAEADAAFRKALKIAPGDAEGADQYGQYLLAAGRLQDALAEIDRAQKLDPLSGIIGATRTNVLTALHRFDDAQTQIGRVTSLHPDYALGHFIAADVAIYRHDYVEAKAQLDMGARLAGENPEIYSRLEDGIADSAQRAAVIRAVLAASRDTHERLTAPARIKWLMLLGDRDDAMDDLQRLGHEISFGQDNVWQPAFDPVRDDPHFQAALKRMGLPGSPTPENTP
jgi:TolB-like protein/Tfp pilus assembly protein PilF